MEKLFIAVLAVALALSGCATLSQAQPTTVNTAAPETEPAATTVATAEPTPEPTPAPTPEPTVDPAAAAAEAFKTAEVNIDNVDAAVEGLFNEGELTYTSTENSGGVIYVMLDFKPASYERGVVHGCGRPQERGGGP